MVQTSTFYQDLSSTISVEKKRFMRLNQVMIKERFESSNKNQFSHKYRRIKITREGQKGILIASPVSAVIV